MRQRKATKDGQIGRGAMREIAEHAGVSIATVSRVLNNRPDVSAATRSSVLRLVRESGYVSSRVARASWETGLIALSVPAFRQGPATEVVAGAMAAIRDHNARLVLCGGDDGADPDASSRARLLEGMTDGALLVLPNESPAEIGALLQGSFPFVAIDPVVPLPESVPVVASANWAGAKNAAEYLIGLGHTHIGLITGPGHWCATADRRAGYQAALLAAGLPLVPGVVRETDGGIEGAARAADQLLASPHVPTAIFALSDGMALGVLRAARERGLAVPQDLSVVGFDDLEMASIVTPTLTSVRQPFQGLGRVGVETLFRLLQGQPLHARRVELSTTLVLRESTGPPHPISFLTF
ncbi:MAG TPA: LacI family DNA-binding transcriptional regulator [Chloroflexota bacterium]|nr:LacI family DNA-binding transcriptional regulator [Chloroflexota bacterium]